MKHITRRHLLFFPLLPLVSCSKSASSLKPAAIMVPSDKVIPPPSCFAEICGYETQIMDDLSVGFVQGKPFKYDRFPYTAVLSFNKPKFDIRIWYWDTPKVALNSFIEGRDNLIKGELGPYLAVRGFKSEGQIRYYTYVIDGKCPASSMVVGNVHFALIDLYRELGEENVMAYSIAYANFLLGGAR